MRSITTVILRGRGMEFVDVAFVITCLIAVFAIGFVTGLKAGGK